MGHVAYKTSIKISGSSVTFTNEACTAKNSKLYQITNVIKRVWDDKATVVVKVAGSTQASNGVYTINYLLGTIEFVNPPASNNVTVSGKYFSLSHVLEAKSYNLNCSRNILDQSNFQDAISNNGFMTKVYGILEASVSLSTFYNVNNAFLNKLKSNSSMLIEIAMTGLLIKGWFIIESNNYSGAVDALQSEEITLQLDGHRNKILSIETT